MSPFEGYGRLSDRLAAHGEYSFRQKPELGSGSGTPQRLLGRSFDMDIASAAAAAFTNAAINERVRPPFRFSCPGAPSAFVGLLENDVSKGVLLAFRHGEESSGDRQRAFVEFANRASAALDRKRVVLGNSG